MRTANRVLDLCLLGSLCLMVIGCSQGVGMKAFDLTLNIDPDLRDSTVTVDVIGVSAGDMDEIPEDRSDYWPNEYFRQRYNDDERVTQTFPASGEYHPMTIGKSDPVWGRWKSSGALWLVVVADLPSQTPFWKDEITLDRREWANNQNTLSVWISRDGGVKFNESPAGK